MEYVYPRDVLPEMNYTEPDVRKACGSCKHSEVTNPGASIPGLKCKLMEKLLKKKNVNIDDINLNDQVDLVYGSCDYWNK